MFLGDARLSFDVVNFDEPLIWTVGLTFGSIATSQLHYFPRTGMGIHLRMNQISSVEELDERPAA
jgi:hypothetical protein